MASITPPLPPLPTQTPSARLPTVTVPKPPPSLSQLPPGTRIEGIVVGRAEGGQVQVQTSSGTISVQTNFPLPEKAELVLQVLSRAPLYRLQLASIDGRPVIAGARPHAGSN